MMSRPGSGKQRNIALGIVFSLLVLLIGTLLSAGCLGEDYVPNHDVIVIKLTSDGSLEWSKIIDKGGDDKAGVVIPTTDGGSIISINFDNYIRYSKDGSILWEKEFGDPICMGDAITQLKDRNFVTVSSGYSVVCKVDKNGNLIWNKSSVKSDRLESSSVFSIIETRDGGFLVAGDSLSRLDSEGNLSWRQSDATNGCGALFSVIQMRDREDFLGLSQKNGLLHVIRLDPNGTITANSSLGMFDGYPSPSIKAENDGYSILFFNTSNSTMETAHLDTEGKVERQRTLLNATIPTIMTTDGGYLSGILRYPDSQSNSPAGSRKISVGVKKLDAEGVEMWTTAPLTFCKPESVPNIDIKTIVQTSDDGYVILGLRDNFWKC